jgi:cytochrome P450
VNEVVAVDVVQLPVERPSALRSAPLLRRLQRTAPVHRVRTRVGDPAWLVTGYAEVRRLLDDDRLGRSHPDPATAARTGDSALFGGPLGDVATEDAEHARMRALLQPHFSPRRIRALRARVQELTGGLLDELAAQHPPADLVAALAVPLPVAVICELLGVPYADRERFREWTRAVGDVRDRARSEQGLADLYGYGLELVARKRREPGEDVLSGLVATEGVDDAEAAALGMSLLFAGHETTVVAIGHGLALLLAEPGRWTALVDRPDRVPAVVEEVLRSQSLGGGGLPRYARTDLDIDGVRVRAGELVLLDLGSANHDGSVFADPDSFDADRTGPVHVTFGHGSRYCLGAPLARVELEVAFTALAARFPTLRLACEPEELRVETGSLTGGLVELPATW